MSQPTSTAPFLVVEQLWIGRHYVLVFSHNSIVGYRIPTARISDTHFISELLTRPLGDKDFSLSVEQIEHIRSRDTENIKLYHKIAVVKTDRQTLRFIPAMGYDSEQFHEFWSNAYPDTVVMRTLEKTATLLQAGTETTAQRLSLAKAVYSFCFIYSLLLFLLSLLVTTHSPLFAVCSVLALPVMLTLYICFPGEFTMWENTKYADYRHSLAIPCLLAGFSPALYSMGAFNIPHKEKLYIISAVVFVIMTALVYLLTKEWKIKKAIAATLLVALLFYAPGSIAQINHAFDTSVPTREYGRVLEMHTQGRRIPSYYLTLNVYSGSQVELKVPASLYNSLRISATVEFYTYSGALGIPYVSLR